MAFLDFLDQVAIQGGEEVKRQRQRRETMDDLVTLEQAKQMLDPTARAKSQALELAQTVGIEPKPLGGYTADEIAVGAPAAVKQRTTERDAETKGRIDALLSAVGVQSKAPKTLEEIFAEAQARASGTAAGKPSPQRRIPQGMLGSVMDVQESLRKARELKAFVEANPELQTGPAEFRLKRGGFSAILGNLGLQYGTPPEQAKKITDLKKLSAQLQDIYRRATTGAQAGFPEIRFLRSSAPSAEEEVRENFVQSLGTTSTELERNLQDMLGVLEGGGYDTTELRNQLDLSDTSDDASVENDPLGIR